MSTPNNPSHGEPTLRPHTYDGIQEYDQRLPNWWLWTLYIAIIYTVVFWIYRFQLGAGDSDSLKLAKEMAYVEQLKAGAVSNITDDMLWSMSKEPDKVNAGKVIFESMCHNCHGKDLTAKLGPAPLPGLPLHDKDWKYSSHPKEIFELVMTGTPMGMPPKGAVATDSVGIANVVAYLLTFHERQADGSAGNAYVLPPGQTPPPGYPAGTPSPAPAAPTPAPDAVPAANPS